MYIRAVNQAPCLHDHYYNYRKPFSSVPHRPSAIISPCSLQRAASPFRPLFSLQFYDGLPSDAWQIIAPDFSVDLVTPSSPAGIHWLLQGPVGATVDAWLPLPVSPLSRKREREWRRDSLDGHLCEMPRKRRSIE